MNNIIHWLKYGWSYAKHIKVLQSVNIGTGKFVYSFSGNSEPCEVKMINGEKMVKFITSWAKSNRCLLKDEWNGVENALYFGYPQIN